MNALGEYHIGRVGPYRLIKQLGAGGMGVVHLGVNFAGEFAAVKIVHPGLAHDEQFRIRFAREVAIGRQVSGPWIAAVIDADPLARIPWLATQYVHGPSLDAAVRTGGPLPRDVVHVVAAGMAAALASIHDAGLIHRDIKPANVLLTTDGPRLIDFGISRDAGGTQLTSTGVIIGTPAFMSPEQVEGEDLGPETDVFSLGATLVHAATGVGPFGEGAPIVMLRRIGTDDPDLGSLAEPVRTAIAACLQRDRQARPSAAELARLLEPVPDMREDRWLPPAVEQLLEPPPLPPTRVEARPPARTGERPAPAPGSKRRPLRRRGVLIGAGLLAAAAAGVGGAALLQGPTRRIWTTAITSSPTSTGNAARAITAISHDTGTLYVASRILDGSRRDDCIHSLDPATGTIKWASGAPSDLAVLRTSGGQVVGGASNSTFAVNDGPGVVRWAASEDLMGIVDQRVITVGTGAGFTSAPVFYAYDLATGTRLWQRSADGTSKVDYRGKPVAATPGSLHVGRGDRVDTIDAATGAIRWTRPWATDRTSASLTAAGATLYVRQKVSDTKYELLAVDGATGDVRWHWSIVRDYSQFAPDRDGLYAAGGGVVTAWAAAGDPRWVFRLPADQATRSTAIGLGPLPGGAALLVSANGFGKGASPAALVAVANGEQRWHHDLDTAAIDGVAGPVVIDTTAFVGVDDTVYAVNVI